MKAKLLCTISLLFSFLIIITPVSAADFSVDVRLFSQYDLLGQGKSTLSMSFTNLVSSKFISSFDLDIPRMDNFFLEAADDYGPIKTEITSSSHSYHARLFFNRDNVGKKAVYRLNVNFPAPNPVKNDNTWEIDLPSFQTVSPPDSFSAQVSVPQAFGELLSAPSAPDEVYTTATTRTFSFLNFSPLKINRLLFGSLFSFKFSAVYHPSTALLLPKDSPGQKIFIDKFSVSPQNVILDSSGNWIALFIKPPAGDVTIEGYALLDSSTADILLASDSKAILPVKISKNIRPYPYLEPSTPNFQLQSPVWLNPFVPTPINIHISNYHPAAIYNYDYKISSPNFYLSGDLENNIPVMPPFSQNTYKFYVRPKFPDTILNSSISISANHHLITYNFPAGSLSAWLFIICVLFSFIIIFLSFVAYRARGLFVHRLRRKNHLRR